MEEKQKIFVDKINNARTIAIMAHKNPDGDAICSVLALAKLIEKNFGKRCLCIYDGNIQEALNAVPLRPWLHYYEHADLSAPFDLVFLLDYGTANHLEFARPVIDKAGFTIEIDHHKNDAPIADLCIDDDQAAATAEIIYNLITGLGLEYDIDIANLLAIAILTDTGFFKFARRGEILHIMADLVDFGVNIGDLADKLSNRPKQTIQVESGAVANAEYFYHDKLAVATIDNKGYKKLDGRGDTVLNLLRQVKGVEYIALLKQAKKEQIGVSLRSSSKPINHIAEALGGGGHERAAGAVVQDTLENVREKLLELFKGI